ncbi:hypothetical protein D3C75_1144980 [compost metagenome]
MATQQLDQAQAVQLAIAQLIIQNQQIGFFTTQRLYQLCASRVNPDHLEVRLGGKSDFQRFSYQSVIIDQNDSQRGNDRPLHS